MTGAALTTQADPSIDEEVKTLLTAQSRKIPDCDRIVG